jgi:hypothetical protein
VWVEELPKTKPSKADLVMKELRTKPNQWAKIAHFTGLMVFPWWSKIRSNSEYEVEVLPTVPTDNPFANGPRDVYARYVGPKK